jgi:uncharacterized repeat protein (TIGR02543 family)
VKIEMKWNKIRHVLSKALIISLCISNVAYADLPGHLMNQIDSEYEDEIDIVDEIVEDTYVDEKATEIDETLIDDVEFDTEIVDDDFVDDITDEIVDEIIDEGIIETTDAVVDEYVIETEDKILVEDTVIEDEVIAEEVEEGIDTEDNSRKSYVEIPSNSKDIEDIKEDLYVSPTEIELPFPYRDGYDFVEWNTERDGSGDSYYAGDVIEITDMTLYAIWQESEEDAEVVLNATGGRFEDDKKTWKFKSNSEADYLILGDDMDDDYFDELFDHDTYYVSRNEVALPEPERENYIFVEWNTARDGSGDGYGAGEIFKIKNITLYAVWEKEAVEVATSSNAVKVEVEVPKNTVSTNGGVSQTVTTDSIVESVESVEIVDEISEVSKDAEIVTDELEAEKVETGADELESEEVETVDDKVESEEVETGADELESEEVEAEVEETDSEVTEVEDIDEIDEIVDTDSSIDDTEEIDETVDETVETVDEDSDITSVEPYDSVDDLDISEI